MARFVLVFILGLLMVFFAMSVACAKNQNRDSPAPMATEIPKAVPALDTRSYLEKRAEDIGVKIQDGHLLIGGQAQVRVLRLVAYLNAEAKARGDDGIFYPYKVSGAYVVGPACGASSGGDCVRYKIHFSHDGKDLSEKSSAAPSYDTLDELLKRHNSEAAAEGREHKIKAWYERKEREGIVVSDRVDIMIHFSFDIPRDNVSPESAILARSFYPLEARQNAIISRTALEFSQLLEKGEALTITTLDFVGPTPNGLEWTYIFDEKAVAQLKVIYEDKIEREPNEILALAEVKERGAKAELPQGDAKRAKEPIPDEEIGTVARIAVETARLINPSLGFWIAIYGFEDRAPKNLTTWVYTFDRAAVITLRAKELTPKEVLQLAKVVEQQGEVPGGRIIPPVKPILREAGKQ